MQALRSAGRALEVRQRIGVEVTQATEEMVKRSLRPAHLLPRPTRYLTNNDLIPLSHLYRISNHQPPTQPTHPSPPLPLPRRHQPRRSPVHTHLYPLPPAAWQPPTTIPLSESRSPATPRPKPSRRAS
ncbi:hypothetical protein BCR35DRAFT_103886 [Leucosporidium creatinivorum]|uniref:Uncharacterized protein n=1 Tax=Leucosporidium creatinivorum TaxID=106004 RepID=A0A1Y2G2G5_9BASI|nr:hypothetical protein BCR35DRAFT_103886 [Leucosporidium creatinivorum]